MLKTGYSLSRVFMEDIYIQETFVTVGVMRYMAMIASDSNIVPINSYVCTAQCVYNNIEDSIIINET